MIGSRTKEGYLLIDNRCSPGVSEEFIRATGKEAPVVREGEMYESAVKTCCGCHRQVILRPDRTRERHYCRKCNSFMCDDCSLELKLTGKHVPMKQVLDTADQLTTIFRQQQPEASANLTLEMLRRSILST